jgi:hypothetical protein
VSVLLAVAAGESDEVSFSFPIEFAFVLTVRLAAMNRCEPSFGVIFERVVDRLGMTADVLTDCRISEPVVGLQKYAFACVVLRYPFTGGSEPFDRLAFLVAEIDDVSLSVYSTTHALRGTV